MTTQGMHLQDIKAALYKKGLTLKDVSKKAGLTETAASKSLRFPCPNAHREIARIIGKNLHEIWPNWYDLNNKRIHGSQSHKKNTIKKAKSHCQKSNSDLAVSKTGGKS